MSSRKKLESSRPELLPADLCAALLTESEDVVSGVLYGQRGPVARFFRRPINTFGIFAAGAERMMTTAFACIGLCLVGCMLVAIARKLGWVDESKVAEWIYVWLTFSILAFSLPMPSRFASRKPFGSSVTRCRAGMRELGQFNDGNLEEIRKCLERVEKATDGTASVMWWLPGAIWAVGVFLTQRGVDRADGNMFGAAFVAFLFAGLGAFLLAAHRRGALAVYSVAYGVLDSQRLALVARKASADARTLRRTRRHDR